MFDLYLITDPQARAGLLETTRAALAGARPGRVAVQLRAKELPSRELLAAARALREMTRQARALLLINDRVDIAELSEADGVHLPERSISPVDARKLLGPEALIGVSRHDAPGLERAGSASASFATVSPFGSAPGKGKPLGPERFAEIARSARIPVFALGGIDLDNVKSAIAAGASGIAVIRAVYASSDPAASVRALLKALDEAGGNGRYNLS